MKRLYFVRHGESELNARGVYAGQTETPLTRKGREQAKTAGMQARELQIDHVVSSPYSRTRDTAVIIADAIGYATENIELTSLFIERGLGALEGQPWNPDLNLDVFADIETIDRLLHRMTLAYTFLQNLAADNILVVGHGASGRALRHVIHPEIPFQGKGSVPFDNAVIVQLV